MARVRLRMGPSEVEIDSRDFYVDNETVRAVIEEMALCMQEAPAANQSPAPLPAPPQAGPPEYLDATGLRNIREAEAPEPEFLDHDTSPEADDSEEGPPAGPHAQRAHSREQVRDGLLMLLDADAFFDYPRTVSDIAQRLRECGWHAGSLAVSEVMTELAICKRVTKNSAKGTASTYVSAEASTGSHEACDGPAATAAMAAPA